MDGPDSLRHVHTISTYRVESLESSPKTEKLLSASAVQIQLPLFSLAATRGYISACCHDVLRDSDRVAEALYEQSSGNPLFLKSLVVEMVRAIVAMFLRADPKQVSSRQLDFDDSTVEWVCDIASTSQQVNELSAYLDEVMESLPNVSQKLLLVSLTSRFG